jgi:transposase
MSKHVVHGGDIAGLLERFAQLREKAQARTGRNFPIIVIHEAGLDGFWIDRVLKNEGIESHVVDPASVATSRRRRRAKTDRIDGEAWFARCWRTSEANPECAQWLRRRLPRKRIIAVSAASAKC